MFHKTTKTTTNAGNFPGNVPENGQNARAGNALATKLALKAPRAFNLSEFPLRVAFARYIAALRQVVALLHVDQHRLAA